MGAISMRHKKLGIWLAAGLIAFSLPLRAQGMRSGYDNWAAFSPFTFSTLATDSPWCYLEYGRRAGDGGAIIIALDSGRSGGTARFPDFWNSIPYNGYADNISLVIGYRKFLWNGLNIEVNLLSGVNGFRSKGKELISRGWSGLTAELRLGYQQNFNLFGIPFEIDPQLQLTYSAIEGIKAPDGFLDPGTAAPRILLFPALQIGAFF
jgi:hypothetical protein